MYMPAKNAHELLFFGFLALSLACSVTNAVPASVAFVFLVPWLLYAACHVKTIPRTAVSLMWLYIYFGASVLLYAPTSLFTPSFYRRDGNFFITFLPLLIGAVTTMKLDLHRIVVGFVAWASAINAVFMVVFLATGGTILYFEPGVYHFLFEAHNAAGGFLATLTALSLGVVLSSQRKALPLVAVAINCAALALTVSRGSGIGLLMAGILILLLRGRFMRSAIACMILATAVPLAITYPLWLEAGRPSNIMSEGRQGLGATQLASQDSNIADRVLFLWPRAYDSFLQSPILGTGFGSYDDLPYKREGLNGIFAVNRPTELVFSAGHAHHTYLHVMAECGLLGLALLSIFLRDLWRNIKSLTPSVRLGLGTALWTAIFASLTEHRLFTPSQMLPITILAGMALADQRWRARKTSCRSLQVADPGAGTKPA